MKTHFLAFTSAAALALGTTTAMAETSATAMTDLNIRSGPGPIYQIIDVIPAEENVAVSGCIESANWCEVTLGDQTGWSYAPYLQMDEQEMTLNEAAQGESETVAMIEFDDQSSEAALVTGAAGAAVGALIAGPVGAVAGGFLSTVAGGVAVQPEVTVYATENPVEPVFVEGEVAVGATVPDTVTVYELPENAEYAYLNINGDTVVIDNESRQIVKIVR